MDGLRLFLLSFMKYSYLLLLGGLLLTSCSSNLLLKSVSYQSFRNANKNAVSNKGDIPQDAEIVVEPILSADGTLNVTVTNLTDSVMVIDRTKSFVNTGENSTTFYDPTVITQTTSDTEGGAKGMTVNMGAVADAFGIGGIAGGLLGAVNLGGTKDNSKTTVNTTYIQDFPQVSLAPLGRADMKRTFRINGMGNEFLAQLPDCNQTFDEPRNSYNRFSMCIVYSLDNGVTWDKITSLFYANSLIVCNVKERGKNNEALRYVLSNKPDYNKESWYRLYFNCTTVVDSETPTSFTVQDLFDYK